MKKITFLTILAVVVFGVASSSGQTFRPKYYNFSLSMQKQTVEGIKIDKRGFGGAFSFGRSYIVHPTPIAGMLRFGVDATWLDINYASYNYDFVIDKVNRHQLDLGLGVGASVHVNPIKLLGVHGYFRYMPTISGMFDKHKVLEDTEGRCGFASFFVAGGAVSWGVVSLGAEARWGKSKYYNLGKNDGKDDDGSPIKTSRTTIKTAGMRIYVGLRF